MPPLFPETSLANDLRTLLNLEAEFPFTPRLGHRIFFYPFAALMFHIDKASPVNYHELALRYLGRAIFSANRFRISPYAHAQARLDAAKLSRRYPYRCLLRRNACSP